MRRCCSSPRALPSLFPGGLNLLGRAAFLALAYPDEVDLAEPFRLGWRGFGREYPKLFSGRLDTSACVVKELDDVGGEPRRLPDDPHGVPVNLAAGDVRVRERDRAAFGPGWKRVLGRERLPDVEDLHAVSLSGFCSGVSRGRRSLASASARV